MYEKLKILYVIGVLVVLFWKMKPLHVFGRVEVPVGPIGPRCWDHSRKRLRRKLQRKKKRRKKRKRIRKPRMERQRMERQRMERMERKSERKSDQWASVASVPAPFFGPNGSAQIVRWRWAGESCQFLVDPRGICSNGNLWNPMVQLAAMMRSYSILWQLIYQKILWHSERFPFLYGWSVNRTWDPKLEAQHL